MNYCEEILFRVKVEGEKPPVFEAEIDKKCNRLLLRFSEHLNDAEGEVLEGSLNALLPIETDVSLESLKSWHNTKPRVDEIIKEFANDIEYVYKVHFYNTNLFKIIRTINEVSSGLTTDGLPTRIIVSVEDPHDVVPWEILFCYYCRKAKKAPLVFRLMGTTITYHISHHLADIGAFRTLKRSKPNEQAHIVESAEWAVKKTSQKPQWLNYSEHEKVKKTPAIEQEFVKVREFQRPFPQKTIKTLDYSEIGHLHYLFARATDDGNIAIAQKKTLSSTDFRKNKKQSPAAIFGLFPIAWSQTFQHSKPWIPLARSAYMWCVQPLFVATTFTPLPASEAAGIAAHLTASIVESCKSGIAVHPVVIAAKLVDWLHEQNKLESLVLVGDARGYNTYQKRIQEFSKTKKEELLEAIEVASEQRDSRMCDQLIKVYLHKTNDKNLPDIIAKKIVDHIVNDRFKEAVELILSSSSQEICTKGVLILGRLKHLKNKTIAGTIGNGDERREHAKIREALLVIVKDLGGK